MIGFFYLILIIFLFLYATIRISIKKYESEKKNYDYLEVKGKCDLHSWERVEDLSIMKCKNCNFIAGSDTTDTEEVE